MDKKTSNLTIGASDNFQRNIPLYGKPNATDTVTLEVYGTTATFSTATSVKAGDNIMVYPFLTSNTVTTSGAGNLVFRVFRYVARKGIRDDEVVTVALAGTEDADAVVLAIETELTTLGLQDLFKVTNQNSKVRIQAIGLLTQLVIEEDGGALGFPINERGKYAWVTAVLNLDANVTVNTNQYYFTKPVLDVDEAVALEYEVVRGIGESTGSSFDITYNSEDYKGNKPVVIQSEVVDATSQMNLSELVFTQENLVFLKGWTEISGEFMGGLTTGVRTFDFTGNSKPQEFEFVSIHRKADGVGLLMIICPRVMSTQNEITLEKTFRVYDETFEIIRADDKTVAIIISL